MSSQYHQLLSENRYKQNRRKTEMNSVSKESKLFVGFVEGDSIKTYH